MRTLLCIITLSMLLCNCGSGMIGLLPDKTGRLVMNDTFVIDQGGTTYTIHVADYYEPNVSCEGLKPLMVVPDWTELNVWRTIRPWGGSDSESVEMENGYIGPVQELLHSEYYNSICGG